MGKKAGKVALGLGLLTGAIAGLLFAPEEGKKIRTKIAKGDMEGLLNDLKSMGHEIKDMAVEMANKPSVLEAIDKVKNKAADVADIKREELDDLLKEANRKAEKFKQAAAKYVKEQKAMLDEKYKKKKKAAPVKSKPKKAAPKKAAPKKAAPKKAAPKKVAKARVLAKKKK